MRDIEEQRQGELKMLREEKEQLQTLILKQTAINRIYDWNSETVNKYTIKNYIDEFLNKELFETIWKCRGFLNKERNN